MSARVQCADNCAGHITRHMIHPATELRFKVPAPYISLRGTADCLDQLLELLDQPSLILIRAQECEPPDRHIPLGYCI